MSRNSTGFTSLKTKYIKIGVQLFRDLKINREVLNLIRKSIGNQFNILNIFRRLWSISTPRILWWSTHSTGVSSNEIFWSKIAERFWRFVTNMILVFLSYMKRHTIFTAPLRNIAQVCFQTLFNLRKIIIAGWKRWIICKHISSTVFNVKI